ncbi:MAG TPA: VCBS repeat-containing protein [Thermoanaerobaculia bacterium]|nr:VCBS repeat-containing protein [Thermoanaerobaculia bacterium]
MCKLVLVAPLVMISFGKLLAQQPGQPTATAARPKAPLNETAEQRLERLGVKEDPGPNPDPTRVYIRWGKEYKIDKYDKKKSLPKFDQKDGWVRPYGWANIAREVYQDNDQFLWVWEPVPEKVTAPPPSLDKRTDVVLTRLDPEQIKFFRKFREDLIEAPFRTTTEMVRFVEASDGLPQDGSWRNSLDVADMNGDGLLDLVVPPQRGPDSAPAIFLGNGKGGWRQWQIQFPVALSYGSAVAADFNRDGKMDLASAVHLCCVIAFLGDGKGKFVESSDGMPTDFPTRRLVVVDVNGDKYPDLMANSEGPVMQQRARPDGRIKLFLNQKGKSWKVFNVAEGTMNVGGDYLTTGDFNQDGKIDVAGSSVYFGGTDLLYLGEGGTKWKPVQRDWLPLYTSYTSLTSGKFTSKKSEDVIISSFRQWPQFVSADDIPPPDVQTAVGLERVYWKDGKPQRETIARWGSRLGVWAISRGDFNKDGNLDIVFVQGDPRRLVILLGDSKGGFKKADTSGITIPPIPIYDVKVADLNKDGWQDIILMYETGETGTVKDGSINVYLNQGGMQTARTAERR